ncbi:LysR family transcriptional regulator [Acidovorax sp. SDU_ACID1]|uniref:LysR family transcriptional regulator n=1 Tax=Acidovorax sp. SDU_ACID1 TaxID=3136632 RepID=UPI0038737716
MRLNLYSLQLFVAVVEEGTIAAAAEREHIATSALSKRISELERLIGTPLLIRQSRGVVPSEAGRTLARGARTLLHGAEDLAAEVRDFASGVTGHVRVAANLSSITQFLAHDIARFLALHPRVKVELEERISSTVTRMVLDNAADIGVFAESDDARQLQVHPYRQDRMALVVPRGHPLAGRGAVDFAATLQYEHVAMHRGSAANNMLARAAAQGEQGFSPRFHVTSYDAMIAMVSAGLGVCVAPVAAVRRYVQEGIALVDLNDAWARRQLLLGVRPDDQLGAAARLLLEHLRGPLA